MGIWPYKHVTLNYFLSQAKDVSDHYPIEFELIETVTEEVLNEEESENSHQELWSSVELWLS